MASGLLIFHIILAAALIGIILLQRNEGGGLGTSSSSMGGFMTTRGTANLLTRTTGILAGCFFATTIVLALIFKGAHNTKSILEDDDSIIIEQINPTAVDSNLPIAGTDVNVVVPTSKLPEIDASSVTIPATKSIDVPAPMIKKSGSADAAKVSGNNIKKNAVKK